jgi:Tfp pilus assembly protein PilF
MKAGSAFPFYQKFIELAQADATKNKRNLVEAYGYMGAYYMNAKDNAQAKQNLDKALELDPNDELAKELLKGLK